MHILLQEMQGETMQGRQCLGERLGRELQTMQLVEVKELRIGKEAKGLNR